MNSELPSPPPLAERRAAAPAAPTAAPRCAQVSSAQLFGGASELQIAHRGAVYRLKQTSTGKLILTK